MNLDEDKPTWVEKFALFAVCTLAFSVSFGVALVSVSCLFVVVASLFYFLKSQTSRSNSLFNSFFNRLFNKCFESPVKAEGAIKKLNSPPKSPAWFAGRSNGWVRLWTPRAVWVALLWVVISTLWTISSWHQLGAELIRTSRILVIPLSVYLIRNEAQALKVIHVWVWGQLIVILTSYWLWMGMQAPWATSHDAVQYFTPFSNTLDQPIMSAVTFGVIWFFRDYFVEIWGNLLGTGRSEQSSKNLKGSLALYTVLCLFLVNVCFLMIGRSGMLSMILTLTGIVWWSLKPNYRMYAVVVPFLIFGILFAVSPKFQDRISKIPIEVMDYKKGRLDTSQAIRLEFWRRSVQAIAEKPLLGYGVGSWPQAYVIALRGEQGIQADSPHQQFLLWWVEEGTVGFLLLFAVYASIFRDALKLQPRAKSALIGALNVLFFTSLMNCPLQGAGISEFFCLIVGALMAFKRLPD